MNVERPVDLARPPEARAEDPARPRLIVLAWLGGIATVTGVGIFCYPSTLSMIRRALVVLHDAAGDLMLAVGLAYLLLHLQRTWRMRKRIVSRWTGYVAIAAWIIAAATGVYGQLGEMPSGSIPSWAHIGSSLALVVLACFHGAWGLRPANPRRTK